MFFFFLPSGERAVIRAQKSVISSILKMEASHSSKTLVSIGVTWLITLEVGGGGWGGGGGKFGTLIYEGVTLERGRRSVCIISQYTYPPFPHSYPNSFISPSSTQ